MYTEKLDKSYLDQILKLESHSAPAQPMYYKYDKEALDQLFDSNMSGVFGAFLCNNLVGWASYRSGFGCENSKDGEYAMSSMVVHKQHRRKGIGTALFNRRLVEIKSKVDAKSIIATAYPKNIGIIILFLKNGFTISDYKKDLYGPGADRIFLELQL